jgi:hypothetical protein
MDARGSVDSKLTENELDCWPRGARPTLSLISRERIVSTMSSMIIVFRSSRYRLKSSIIRSNRVRLVNSKLIVRRRSWRLAVTVGRT